MDAHDLDLRDPPLLAAPVPEREARIEAPVDHPGAADGALSGRAVYLSQCHGWIWYDTLDAFSLQRGNVWDTVEDIHNPEGMNQFLTAYLENAGARVFTVKERDLNPLLAVVDDGDPGYAEAGEGFADGEPGFAWQDTWAYGENPFDLGGTRRFPANGGAVATWTPEVPADGHYAVYVSWDAAADHARDAHYRLTHPGGTIDRRFDQTVHGSTWQYVETLWLTAGESLVVELVGDASDGDWLSADAVRIGGGTGVIERHGETTGRPRWEEGAILATQFNGAPESIYDPYGDGNGSDPSSRARWADWEHPAGEDALYLSWHSNACDGCDARGTVVYTYDATCSAGAPVDGSTELAEALQDEIVSAATLLWDSDWNDRGTNTDCFSENNPSHNDEMPSALVELAFHDTEIEADFLKDPQFRRDAARAMYRAIVRYWAERDGADAYYLPEPPVAVALRDGADGLVLSWEPGVSGWPWGDAAEGYLVYTSADGRAWGEGVAVSGTSTTLDASAGETVYARVAATNVGGVSFASETVAARRGAGEPPVLIVAAFDRLDDGQLAWEDLGPSLGEVVKMDVRRMNGADVAVPHAAAIAAAGWPFDTVSDEAFDALDLAGYRLVVWATGEESTADETFSTAQQEKLRAFHAGGGALWASGAEILWDLDERGGDDDRAFAREVLGATMASDDAGTDRVAGAGQLAGLTLDFADPPYPIEWPDTLETDREPLAVYETGEVAAAIGDRVALFGYPFEAIGGAGVRAEVASRLLPALVPDYTPPDAGVTAGDDTGEPLVATARADRAEAAGCGCDTGATPFGISVLLAALTAARRSSARPSTPAPRPRPARS
ncbi:MAG: N-acetylmuramoyl-L-alanine amidase [Myxococcota bacterium]